jgi:hypothetical protein
MFYIFFSIYIISGWKPTVYSNLLYPKEHIQAIYTEFKARWNPVQYYISARALFKMLLRPTSIVQLYIDI